MKRAARDLHRKALMAAVAIGLVLPFTVLTPRSVAAAGIAEVQAGAVKSSGTGNVTPTLPVASIAGTLLVAVVANGGTASSMPFSGPAGWVNATGAWQSGNGRAEIWYYPSNPGGIASAAFTSSASSISALGQLSEWSGAASSGVLDQTGTTTVMGATSATVSTSGATIESGELGITLLGTIAAETTFTAGGSWAHLYSQPGNGSVSDARIGVGSGTVSEAETASPTATGWLALIATFEPVPSAPGPVGSLTAIAGANQATVSWSAPSTGSPVTEYVVTALSGGVAARNTTAIPGSSTTTIITGLTGGTAYKFSVYGVNAAGAGATTTTASSITPTGVAYPYTAAVMADSPIFYYRLDETAGATALDSSGNTVIGTEVAAPTQGSAGTLATDTDLAAQFNGSTQYAYSNTSYSNPTIFTIEAWFKTATVTGGKIVGFGSSQIGSSASYDRHIYMANSGKLFFGVWAGAAKTVNSTSAYNDGNPHHVVATLSGAGMSLYVDGALVASDSTITSAQNYTGYWRIGYDSLAAWPSAPTSNYFNGTIDEVAVYSTALSLQRDQIHYCTGANANCLSMTSPATVTFPALTINGLDHTQTVTATFDVIDNTGGSGWNILATSTTFTTGAHKLSTTATTVVSAPSSACDGGFTCTAATNSVSYPYTLPAATIAPAATKLINAAVGTGMGHQTITTTFSLAVPGNAYAGTYTSTWTFTLSSGP